MVGVMDASTVCPCGGYEDATTYAACCKPYVADGVPAPTCEHLMRSRYTAFALADVGHLWRTWHPRTRPTEVVVPDGVTWQRLEVLASEAGGVDDTEGTVDFAAHLVTDAGERAAVREHSRFARRAGRWFYVDGDELA